jgi:hypothetical protein
LLKALAFPAIKLWEMIWLHADHNIIVSQYKQNDPWSRAT